MMENQHILPNVKNLLKIQLQMENIVENVTKFHKKLSENIITLERIKINWTKGTWLLGTWLKWH